MHCRRYTRRWEAGGTDMQHLVSINDTLHHVWLGRTEQGYSLHVSGRQWWVALEDRRVLHINNCAVPVVVAVDGDRIYVHMDGTAHELAVQDPVAFHVTKAGGAVDDDIRAPMPGSVIAIPVKVGDVVSQGDTLLIIESMKLETAVKAPRDSEIEAINFVAGQNFQRDAVLVTLVPRKG